MNGKHIAILIVLGVWLPVMILVAATTGHRHARTCTTYSSGSGTSIYETQTTTVCR